MKRKYESPYSLTIEMSGEKMIASSLGKSPEHAGDDFQELSNKKNQEGKIWNGKDSYWK